MKGREARDVRLILDTDGERVAEQKRRKKALHTAGLRPLSELENMGAGDTERTEGLANALINIHTSIYISSLTFSHTLTSK